MSSTSKAEKMYSYLSSIQKSYQSHGVSSWISERYRGLDGLTVEAQDSILSHVQKTYEILGELERTRINQNNAREALPAFLKLYGLSLWPGTLDRIKEDDFFEIYNWQGQPVYKSPKFQQMTTYSLDEVYMTPFPELFERDHFSLANIERAVRKIFSGESRLIEKPILTHQAWEKRGPIRVEITYKFLAGCVFSDQITEFDVQSLRPVPAPYMLVISNLKLISSADATDASRKSH